MDALRRTLLKSAATAGVLGGLLAAGVLKPTRAYASDWNKAAFQARELDEAVKALGAAAAAGHKDLILKAPDVAENGADVQLDIVSNIPNTTSLAVLVKENPFPLAGQFEFSAGAAVEVSLRLKIAESSLVRAIARADGKFYSTQKEIKVTVGGCAA